MVHNDLRVRLEECLGKLSHHADVIRDYFGWQQALAANAGAQFKWDIEDWLFFFGRH